MTNEWSIHAEGHGMLSKIVFKDKRLNSNAKVLYATLTLFADKQGNCYPSIETICDMSGLSRKTVYKYKKELIQFGYIESYRPRNKNEQYQSCQYKLLGYSKSTPYTKQRNNINVKEIAIGQQLPHGEGNSGDMARVTVGTWSEKRDMDGNTIISSLTKKKPCGNGGDTNRLTNHINKPLLTDQALQPSLDNISSKYNGIYDATVKYAKEVENYELNEQEKIAIEKLIEQTKGKYEPKIYFDLKDEFKD